MNKNDAYNTSTRMLKSYLYEGPMTLISITINHYRNDDGRLEMVRAPEKGQVSKEIEQPSRSTSKLGQSPQIRGGGG